MDGYCLIHHGNCILWFICYKCFIDFIEYHVDAITGGTDALIDVIIKLQKGDKIISARGTEPDIINASVKAYISGVNRLLSN